jgi:FMN phosphatase YigB (HAD superfamily)
VIVSKRDLLDLPFVTNEQKFEYWQRSKQEHKDALEYIAQLEKLAKEYERYLAGNTNSPLASGTLQIGALHVLASKPESLKK